MKRYKIVTLLLLFTLFTGCQTDGTDTQPKDPSPAASQTEELFDTNLTVSIGFWDIQDMKNPAQSDALLDFIETKFNITIEPVPVNWSDYKERYQILSATKSLPDIFASVTVSSSDNNDSANLNNMISSKSIRSLPEDLSRFPNIVSLLQQCGSIQSKDGKYYFIPRSSFQDKILGSSDAAMIVRKDWMEKLGFTEPKSLDEFIDLVCAFANNDPDGNGLRDTIGYEVNNRIALGKWLMLGIAPECNVYSWISTEDGYIPSYLTEDFKKVIVAYRTLYERGGLDPGFYIKKPTDTLNDFANGKLGALEYKSSPSSIAELQAKWDIYQDVPFEDCVDVIHIFPADDGNYYSNSSSFFWSESLFSSAVDDEKMERILYLYDYLLSDEGLKLLKYGFEGEDYTVLQDEFHCLLDTNGTSLIKVLQKKYPSLLLFGSLASWGGSWDDFDDNEINTLRYGVYSMELANKELVWNSKNTIQIERPYDFLLMPKESTEAFNTEAVLDDITRVIIGTEDPLEMWDSVVTGYYEHGLEDYIARQNELYKEYSGSAE